MALNGTVNSSGYEGRYVQLTWSATQSVANNTSTISWKLKGAGNASSSWYNAGGFYVKIAGTVVCNWSTDTRITLYNGTEIASGSLTVSHNADGTKSFSVEVQAGIYTYARNCSGSGSFALNTIARASQPSCITFPDNTQNVGDIGGSFYIHMNKKANFKHTVRYVWGNLSDTIATNVVDNVQWTIPLNFANQIPNSTSGWGIIYVDTYNGSTKIGTKSCRFDATVPSYMIPTISSATIEIDNSANSVIKNWGLYVVGYSKAKITAAASGSYGSTISSFSISGGYATTQSGSSLSYLGDKFTSSGDKTFNIVAKDSRGRSSASKSAGTITVYAYSTPTISALSVQRSSSNAKKIVVRANWSFASVNGKNSVTATLYYKLSTSSSWTTYGTISKNTDVILDGDFAEEHSYNFKLIVKDAIGNSAQNESFISTIDVLLDFKAGGKGLGIGKIAETDSMEVAMDANFYDDVIIKNVEALNGIDINLRDYLPQLNSSINNVQLSVNSSVANLNKEIKGNADNISALKSYYRESNETTGTSFYTSFLMEGVTYCYIATVDSVLNNTDDGVWHLVACYENKSGNDILVGQNAIKSGNMSSTFMGIVAKNQTIKFSYYCLPNGVVPTRFYTRIMFTPVIT